MTLKPLRLAGLCAALALAAPAAFAQTTPAADAQLQPGREGRMGRGGADMFKELNLTTEQQTKIQTIMREGRGERPSSPPTEADRQAMQVRRAEMETKIKAVLTPEQLTKYEALRTQRMRPTSNN